MSNCRIRPGPKSPSNIKSSISAVFAQNHPQFFDHTTPKLCFHPDMHIFLESGWLGKSSPASEFLISGYGKKSNFRRGTQNRSIKSELGTVGTVIAWAKELNGTRFAEIRYLFQKLSLKNPQYISFLDRL